MRQIKSSFSILCGLCGFLIIAFLILFGHTLKSLAENSLLSQKQVSNPCQVNTDCDDNITLTQDICVAPNTPVAVCKHKSTQPMTFADGFPQNGDQTNLLKFLDTISSWQVKIKNGNDKNNYQTLTGGQINKTGKISASHVNYVELGEQCGVYDKATGKIMNDANGKPVDLQPTDLDNCVKNMVNFLSSEKIEKKDASGNQLYQAVSYDEIIYSMIQNQPEFYEAMAKAFFAIKQKYPYLSLCIWVPSYTPSTTNSKPVSQQTIDIFKDIFSASDYAMFEEYIDDSLADTTVKKRFDNDFSQWKAFDGSNFPGNTKNILFGLNVVADMEDQTWDLDPGRDFYALLDYQFQLLKEKIDQKEIDGVALFNCDVLSVETQKVVGDLINHYFKNGDTNLFYGDPTDLTYIHNAGFEDATSWNLTPGAQGKIDYVQADSKLLDIRSQNPLIYQTFNSNYGRLPQVIAKYTGANPEKARVLQFTRGADKNLVTQPITGLTTGNYYKFDLYSKKMSGDYGKSDVKTHILDANNADIDSTYTQSTLYNDYTNWNADAHYNIPLATCVGQKSMCSDERNLWTKEELIFKAPATDLNLAIDDLAAADGELNIIDFAELQPYRLDSFDISADRDSAKKDDIITYTVRFSNLASASDNISGLSVPLPEGTEFVSASDGGKSDGTAVSWPAFNTLKSSNTLFLTFKVKVL